MKKTLLLAMLMSTVLTMSAGDLISLPAPDKGVKTTLIQALQARHSSREYAATELSDATLSTVLWAACGINRPDEGKITAPSAINAQDIIVFVVRKDGAYRYEPKSNALTKVSGKDLRQAVAGRQDFAATAPVSLVLASDHSHFPAQMPEEAKSRMGMIDAGYVSQNICLIAEALGLNTVPRMTMDTQTLKKELNLGETYDLVLNSQLGYPNE